ncbi:ubiquitin-protein ligase molybdopterin-converting factor [Sistotremastrum niveocremeum HHB9708]|uniref:Ubiquitin-protein ligase molybdopterin-converting factor n=1 Tax=Sistotremastrum niveocremeum HHB9708 TaxID=1314777 RepID=A0A164PDL7_9AGAM|nr:ubiquitin-protein ligase molybdopterin-converting factor [Sistotremastrum niveocremeum HHB9708]
MSRRPPVVELAIAAFAASSATAIAIFSYQAFSRRQRRIKLSEEVNESLAHELDVESSQKSHRGTVQTATDSDLPILDEESNYDETLIREQLTRNYAFFGDEGMKKIRGSKVAVIGCGGVGSWAAVMLVRSGISSIRLVDFDYVTLSSLNRHATATLADVGTPKVKCVEKALKSFSKWIKVESCIELWRAEDGGWLLDDVDWVVDAIDNIGTKVDLLKYCHEKGIKVFASMGAGAKCDPTRIQISDISHTVYDPLARAVRRRLRAKGISFGIPVVYSTEVPGDVKLLPLPEEEFAKGSVNELGVFDDFRVRILPVLGPLPSIFGLNIATYILCELAGKPIPNPLPIKGRRKLYEKLLRDLQVREAKLTGTQINRMPIDEDDVSFLFEDVHRGRSVIPPHAIPQRPTLVKWDQAGDLTLENIVVMEIPESERHVKEGAQVWGEEVKAIVKSHRKEIKEWRTWVGV